MTTIAQHTLKRIFQPLLILVFIALAAASAPPRAQADAAGLPDWVIPWGHFYTQTSGGAAGDALGYAVVDDEDAPFWTSFQRFGGLAALGYPISQRFEHHGMAAQAFQKGIILWDARSQSAHLMNLFDELSAAGADPFLETHRLIPPSADWSQDDGQPWGVVVANHLALLEADPAIKAAYYAGEALGLDAITLNGLPMSIREYDAVIVLRAQRRAFQHWKSATPWAQAGQVVVVNGGELAKELNLIPVSAQAPAPAPAPPFGAGNPELGAAPYHAAGCVLCHGTRAEGGIGPALVTVRLDFPTFVTTVRAPTGAMPSYLEEHVSEQELRDILAYVLSQGAAPQADAPQDSEQ